MKLLTAIRAVMVGASCVGIVLPTSVAGAANPWPSGNTNIADLSRPVITDIVLGENGTARGQVVDAQGVAVPGSSVVLSRADQELARVAADGRGNFRVSGLRGGVYRISSGQGGGTFRLWAPGTAPPAAREIITVVEGGDVVRGQMPVGDYFASDRFILLTLIATAIAIPVVVYNNRTSGS